MVLLVVMVQKARKEKEGTLDLEEFLEIPNKELLVLQD
jgi:hypothetical protein